MLSGDLKIVLYIPSFIKFHWGHRPPGPYLRLPITASLPMYDKRARASAANNG